MKTELKDLVKCSSQPPSKDNPLGITGPLERLGNIDLPVKTGFRFAELMDAIDKQLGYFLKIRLDLYKKHGDHDEENDSYTLTTPEQQEAFQKEYDELLCKEIELPGQKFKMSDFFTTSRVKPNDIRTLKWLIDFGVTPSAVELKEVKKDISDDILELGEPESQAASA